MSQWEQPDEDEEQEEDSGFEAYGKEQIVFLIDCAPNMFDEKIEIDEGKSGSSFSIALSTIADFIKKRIVSGAKDEFAVVFYNTEKESNSMKHPNVYVYVPRAAPDANMVQRIQSLSDKKFHRDLGSLQVTPSDHDSLVKQCDALRNGLWVTMDVLQTQASKNARHRIIMFSNTEDPVRGLEPAYRMLVLERGVPLKELGATLRFFPLISCKKPFKLSVFWDELIRTLKDPEDEYSTNPVSSQFSQVTQGPLSSEDVRTRLLCLGEYMKKCLQQRRSLGTVRWSISEELVISCQVYTLFIEAKKPWTVKLRASDNALLESKTTVVSEDTGVELMNKVEKKQFRNDKVASRFPRVVLTLDEVAAVKYYLPPGLKLLGFKPQTMLQDYHNLTHSSFLRPTERDIKGSTAVFKALLEAMDKKNCVAICTYVRTKRSEPCHVALLPQREELDEQGYQVWAEGLHLIKLPFKDDVRAPETDPNQVGTELPVAGPDQVEVAQQLVKALQFEDFNLGSVTNPTLDRHFEVLEALAMRDEPPDLEDFQDLTLPPSDQDVEQLAGDQLQAFKEAVQLGVESAGGGGRGSGGAGTKRKAPPEDLSVSEAYTRIPWQDHYRDDTLKKLTLPDLKVFLKFHKLKQSGNKSELIEKIKEHIEKKGV